MCSLTGAIVKQPGPAGQYEDGGHRGGPPQVRLQPALDRRRRLDPTNTISYYQPVTRDTPSWGSAGLDDDEFVRQFENGTYPNACFRHADHVRLAWIYVRRYGAAAAEARTCDGIRRFACRLGHEEKYHETLTRAWLRLVAVAHGATPAIDRFDAFAGAHAWLFDAAALSAFYSAGRLHSPAARREWMPPDLRPLPPIADATALPRPQPDGPERTPPASPPRPAASAR
jgi:hypothetical protein